MQTTTKTKSIFLLFLCLSFLIPAACKQELNSESVAKKTPGSDYNFNIQKDRKIVVYYFHTTYRCHSCTELERLTRESINNTFQNLLKSGKLAFKSVNVDKAENKHFIEDYQLFTKSVVIVDYKKGKQMKWKRLDKTWTYLREPDVFTQYIEDEVVTAVKG